MNKSDYAFLFETLENHNLCLDEELLIDEVVTEASSKKFNPKPGEVYNGYMYYNNFKTGYNNGYKNRWVVIVNDLDHGLVAIRASSTKPGMTSKDTDTRYNVSFRNWQNEGFTDPSYLVGNDCRLLQYVKLTRYNGKLEDSTLDDVMIRFENFKTDRENSVFMLMDYFKFVSIQNPKKGFEKSIMQTPKEVFDTETANTIDICTSVRNVCNNYKIDHKFVRLDIDVSGKRYTQFYCVFLFRDKSWRTFRFMSGVPANGIIEITGVNDVNKVIEIENKWYKDFFAKIGKIKLFQSYVLDDDDMKFWDRRVMMKSKQIEMVQYTKAKRDIPWLNKTLTEFKWGCVIDGKDCTDEEGCWDSYRTLTQAQFVKAKMGCCWDYVNYQYWYFGKHFPNVKVKCWYIESEPIGEDSTNHTWMSYELPEDSHVYAFESSWKVFTGIHRFDNENDMMDFYVKNQFRNHKQKPDYVIFEYTPYRNGISPEIFMRNVFVAGKLARSVGKHYELRIKPIIDNNDWSAMRAMWSDKLEFYHMVPKGTDISKGLLAPKAMVDLKMYDTANNALNKYRERMCWHWKFYPKKKPEELTLAELLHGLERFRGKGGSRAIYFFRFPPTKELGKNMTEILDTHDIYRINLKDKELQKHIERVDWGYLDSNNDNPPYDQSYYERVSEEEYFIRYQDMRTDDKPLFSPIAHIGVIFKNGICPREFLTKIRVR